SPNLTTVSLPPAKGRSIGRNRVDWVLELRPRKPAAASKLGKIQSPQMGRIHQPLKDFCDHRSRPSPVRIRPAVSWRRYMCGIVGFVDLTGRNLVEEKDADLLRKLARQIAHRGPDDEQVHLWNNVGLAFRRLSIVDVDGGEQPLFNENK